MKWLMYLYFHIFSDIINYVEVLFLETINPSLNGQFTCYNMVFLKIL